MQSYDEIYKHTKETIGACKKQLDAYHVALQGLAKSGMKIGAVILSDEALDNKPVVRLSFGMKEASNKILMPSAPGKMASYEALHSSVVTIADYSKNEYVKSDLELRHGIQKAIFAPIRDVQNNKTIGILMGVCDGLKEDASRIGLVEKIAALLGNNISKLQSMKSVEYEESQKTMRLEASSELPIAFQECIDAEDIDTLSEKVLEYCLKFTSSQFGFVGYIDQNTGFLVCPTMTKDIFPSCKVEGKTVIFEKAGGLGGHVLDRQKAMIANDPVSHPASVGTPPGHIPIRKFMGVPCVYHGKTVGMVALANKDIDYNEADLGLATTFAVIYASCVAGFFAKENLIKSEHSLKELYDNAPCGYFTMSADGNIQRYNDTMRSLIGSDLKNINDNLTSESKELLSRQILLFQETGSAQPVELDFITSQGEIINTVHSISGAKDERGYVSSLFCTIIDISELKATQKKLNEVLVEANKNLKHKVDEAVAEIRQKDEALIKQSRLAAMGETIATIAHEWRQPLNALGIQIQDLKLAYDCGEVNKEYIKEATTKSMRLIRSMSDMIDNFRKLFITDEIQAEEFRIVDAIDNAMEQLRLKNSIGELEIKINCNEEIVITGHASELSQAIFNLLENAKEAITSSKPSKPLITLDVKEENSRCVIEIENYGNPIPNEDIDRIFEPYYSTKKQASGVGLGLFITKIIIEKSLNGKISVSNTDNGVKFTINIPV